MSSQLGIDRRNVRQVNWFPVESVGSDVVGPFVQRILSQNLGAVIVEQVFSPDACLAWSNALDSGRLPVAPTKFAQEFEAWSYGPCLDQCEGRLDEYLARSASFEDALAHGELGNDIAGLVLAQIGRLALGLSVERPHARDGRQYALMNLRRLPPGGIIPPHCENEQFHRAAYDDLRSRLHLDALLSFYVSVRPADIGGRLAVHDATWSSLREQTKNGHLQVGGAIVDADFVSFQLPPGSMIIFDGGRWVHQILPVEGTRNRWTMGGFLALGSARDRIFAWA